MHCDSLDPDVFDLFLLFVIVGSGDEVLFWLQVFQGETVSIFGAAISFQKVVLVH